MSEVVQYDVNGDVATITLNRPEALNALNGPLLKELAQYGADAANDKKVRAVIITGAGRAFSSGGDLRGVGTDDPLDPLRNVEQLRKYEEISLLLAEMPKPTIAAINGVAAGAGFSIALSADFRIASQKAKFLTAFAKAGLTGDFGGTWLLERIVGTTKAKELYLLGNTITAQEAEALGIVNQVCVDEELIQEAQALAKKLAAGPTDAFARIKKNFAYGSKSSLTDLLAFEAGNMIAASKTEDFKNAVTAFFDKREPKFEGK